MLPRRHPRLSVRHHKIDLSGYFIASADLAEAARGLLLSFPAVYETGEILLEGVRGVRAGDIVFG
ncbi:hypothetical protein [Teichococcus oryzae]|uniref:Uncharacterized protein n=1 Tax=Teichococcus oryzae TaxID=1608942 RepID=A0A5B2TAL3_9PROT|nr:hypothetical protein [Pseudoroseomonas oryzae]KAA2211562.1 hypothetical protein F0Q34_19350 [Pseudoroseomonas oryzae]